MNSYIYQIHQILVFCHLLTLTFNLAIRGKQQWNIHLNFVNNFPYAANNMTVSTNFRFSEDTWSSVIHERKWLQAYPFLKLFCKLSGFKIQHRTCANFFLQLCPDSYTINDAAQWYTNKMENNNNKKHTPIIYLYPRFPHKKLKVAFKKTYCALVV